MGPKRKRPTAHEAFIDDKADDGDDNLALSDEEQPEKSDKKIRAKDGQLGFYHKNNFDSRTNFTLEVKADIFSKCFQLKGKVHIIIQQSEHCQEIFFFFIIKVFSPFHIKKFQETFSLFGWILVTIWRCSYLRKLWIIQACSR